jgi:hypothetical protein
MLGLCATAVKAHRQLAQRDVQGLPRACMGYCLPWLTMRQRRGIPLTRLRMVKEIEMRLRFLIGSRQRSGCTRTLFGLDTHRSADLIACTVLDRVAVATRVSHALPHAVCRYPIPRLIGHGCGSSKSIKSAPKSVMFFREVDHVDLLHLRVVRLPVGVHLERYAQQGDNQ